MTSELSIPRERFYVAAAVALAAFVVYTKTLCGDVFWQDSGLFNRSVGLLGSGVPPGFPGWHLACYLFAMLPGINPIVGMNLFSAVAGAATAFLVVLLVYELADGGWAAAAGAAVAGLAYSLAPTVWIQSTTCEVYTMNMALTAATILALFVWRRRADVRWFYVAAFTYGVACTNHPQQAVLLIPYAAFVFWHRRSAGLHGRQLYVAGALWLLAMSTYLYLPVRSAAGVVQNWGKPGTLYGLYFHLTAKEFQHQMFSAPWAVVGWRMKTAAWLYLDQFRWVGIATGAVGAAWLAWRRRGDFLYFVAIVFFTLILTVNYPSFGFRAWYFPFYMLTAMCAGVAVTRVGEALAKWRHAATYVFLGLAVVVALSPVLTRFYQADRTYYPYVRDFGANYLRSVGYADFLFLGEENSAPTTGIQALTTLEYARPDIFFVDTTGNANYFDVFDFGGRDLSHAPVDVIVKYFYEIMSGVLAEERHDYYFLYPYDFVHPWGYNLAKDGAVYRVIRRGSPPPRDDVITRYVIRGVDPPTTYLDHWARGTVGNFLYEMYLRYESRDEPRAEEYFMLADRVGRRAHEVQHNLGTVFYLKRDYAGAVPYFERAVALEPTDSFTRYLLADCYHELGRTDDSRREVETALRYRPGYGPATFTLETGSFIKW
jgi:4-amino-4-deoxy-L-arabinose transferase-like glycosyltransferase